MFHIQFVLLRLLEIMLAATQRLTPHPREFHVDNMAKHAATTISISAVIFRQSVSKSIVYIQFAYVKHKRPR